MKLPSTISITAICCMLLSSCSRNPNRDSLIKDADSDANVMTTVRHSWNPKATATLNKVFTGAWSYDQLAEGDSVVVRLYRSDKLVQSFDGTSAYEVVFQIPSGATPGQEFTLTAVPETRPGTKGGEHNDQLVTSMADGDIVAFRYANPKMGWMTKAKEATVTIAALSETRAIIHLKLKSKLNDGLKIDIDEQFIMQVTSEDLRESDGITSMSR